MRLEHSSMPVTREVGLMSLSSSSHVLDEPEARQRRRRRVNGSRERAERALKCGTMTTALQTGAPSTLPVPLRRLPNLPTSANSPTPASLGHYLEHCMYSSRSSILIQNPSRNIQSPTKLQSTPGPETTSLSRHITHDTQIPQIPSTTGLRLRHK